MKIAELLPLVNEAISKGYTLKRKNLLLEEQILSFKELIPIRRESASPEDVPIHLRSFYDCILSYPIFEFSLLFLMR